LVAIQKRKITYKRDPVLSPDEVIEVFRRSGIVRPVEDVERIQKMLVHANLVIGAFDGGRLVGIARSLTDFCFACYLSDLAVDKDFQREGIGQELIRLTEEAIGEESMLLLIAAPAAMDYYPHVGFEKMDRAWIKHRKR
jgi:predicted N-acetyltransferase YhbS